MRRVLAALGALLLAAHALRSGASLLLFPALALAVLAFVPRTWAWWTARIGLGLGALEWLRVLLVRIGERQAEGQPWLRLALILGGVALFTALAALFLPPPRKEPPASA